MRRLLGVFVSGLVLVATSMAVPSQVLAGGATLYVANGPEGFGGPGLGGPGTSCSNPGYRSEDQSGLTAALEDAAAGDTVRVCAGEYIYDGFGYSDALPNGVAIVGAGIGKTILNGDDQYFLLSIQGGNDIVIRGITFTQGSDTYGAGLTLYNTEATVIDSAFVNNSTTRWGADYGGAGIYVYDDSNVTVINSEFEGNVADEDSAGAAINVYTSSDTAAILRVEQSKFVGNEAGQGPAVYYYDDDSGESVSEITLINNTFVQNVNTNPDDDSADGGAVAFEHTNGNLTMVGNQFFQNSGASFGGAVEIWDVTGTIIVEGNSFLRNVAGEGGALWIDVRNGTRSIRGNMFKGNVATGLGGAIAFECETQPARVTAMSLQKLNKFIANRTSSRRSVDVYASEYGCN
jgi:hypothetical protein